MSRFGFRSTVDATTVGSTRHPVRRRSAVGALIAACLALGVVFPPADAGAVDPLVSLSGVVRDTSGVPVSGVNVSFGGSSVTTDGSGGYSIFAAPGTSAQIVASIGDVFSGGRSLISDPFTLSADRVEDLTLPALATLTVNVEDAAGSLLVGATVRVPPQELAPGIFWLEATDTGSLSNGTSFNTRWSSTGLTCAIDGPDSCTLTAPLGWTTPTDLTVSYTRAGYPTVTEQYGPWTFTTPSTTTTLTLDSYAVLQSAGSTAGVVVITTADGAHLTSLAIEPVSNTLPSDAIALVGSVGFSVPNLPLGGTASITLTLPAGSAPNRLYKFRDGAYVDVTSLGSFSGDQVTLTLTDGGLGDEDGVANGTIIDPIIPARLPLVSVGDVSVVEGDIGQRVGYLPVTLSEPASQTVTVRYRIGAGSATAGTSTTVGADFNHKGGATKTLIFKVGSTGKTPVVKYVAVPIYPDGSAEADETFTVTLSSPTGGYEIGRSVATGTIIDDDASTKSGVEVSVGDVQVVEGTTGRRAVKATLSLSAPATHEVRVDFTIVSGSASCGEAKGGAPLDPSSDCDNIKGVTRTVVFKVRATGTTSVNLALVTTVFPDLVVEPDESYTILLSNPVGATLGRDTSVITITNDD